MRSRFPWSVSHRSVRASARSGVVGQRQMRFKNFSFSSFLPTRVASRRRRRSSRANHRSFVSTHLHHAMIRHGVRCHARASQSNDSTCKRKVVNERASRVWFIMSSCVHFNRTRAWLRNGWNQTRESVSGIARRGFPRASSLQNGIALPRARRRLNIYIYRYGFFGLAESSFPASARLRSSSMPCSSGSPGEYLLKTFPSRPTRNFV